MHNECQEEFNIKHPESDPLFHQTLHGSDHSRGLEAWLDQKHEYTNVPSAWCHMPLTLGWIKVTVGQSLRILSYF